MQHIERVLAIAIAPVTAACLIACSEPDAPPAISPADAAVDAPRAPDDAGSPLETSFHEGPYGTGPRDVAGPFTLPTTDGDFDFRASWTGASSYVFVVDIPGNAYAEALWSSPIEYLLEESPEGAHYFFLSFAEPDGTDRAAEHVGDMRARAEAALAALPPDRQDHWRPRLHYVSIEALALEGWIAEMLRARPVPAFAIDRAQRIREVGLLGWPVTSTLRPQIHYVAYEVRLFDFEAERDRSLAAESATVVPLLRAMESAGGDVDFTATLPDAAAMAAFDTLEVDLSTSCRGHLESSCWEWDRLASLYLCSAPSVCDVELARWVTTYRREGRWVTDITPALAHIASGGARSFRFTARAAGDATPYVIDLALRLSSRARDARPSEAVHLFDGRPFDASYNDSYSPVDVNVPADVRRVELFALITGHGWGADVANCAEFCDHTHHFAVNGTEWVKEHPEAGTMRGCLETVGTGTVPNQFGTWPLGRGGWCPGRDVTPFVVDVTSAIHIGGDNTITYRALVDGVPYVPVPSGMTSGGYPAEIQMSSWLVLSR